MILITIPSKRSNGSIWQINVTLTDTTTPGQSRPESNGNEGVHYIPQSSRSGASLSDGLVVCSIHLLHGVLPLCTDAVSIFKSANWQGIETFKIYINILFFFVVLQLWGYIDLDFTYIFFVSLITEIFQLTLSLTFSGIQSIRKE